MLALLLHSSKLICAALRNLIICLKLRMLDEFFIYLALISLRLPSHGGSFKASNIPCLFNKFFSGPDAAATFCLSCMCNYTFSSFLLVLAALRWASSLHSSYSMLNSETRSLVICGLQISRHRSVIAGFLAYAVQFWYGLENIVSASGATILPGR